MLDCQEKLCKRSCNLEYAALSGQERAILSEAYVPTAAVDSKLVEDSHSSTATQSRQVQFLHTQYGRAAKSGTKDQLYDTVV